jgi:hypothetical protein
MVANLGTGADTFDILTRMYIGPQFATEMERIRWLSVSYLKATRNVTSLIADTSLVHERHNFLLLNWP